MITAIPDRLEEAAALLARVHGPSRPLAAEYPLVFDGAFPGRLVAVGEDDEVRSACTTLTRELVFPGGTLRSGLIGLVSTDERFRERGLATRTLVQAEAQLLGQGCALALLWADQPGFYLQRGFTPIGAEVDFRLEGELAGHLPRFGGVRRLREGDAAGVHALYARHEARVERSEEETAALLACPGMETLVAEREGVLVGYACCGRGADLPDTIHEWGGALEPVLGLVRAHLERRFGEGMRDAHGALFLMAPPSAREVAAHLQAAGAARADGILGLARVLDHEEAARALEGALGEGARVTSAVTASGLRFTVHGPADEGELDEEGFLALLVGGAEVRPQVRSFCERFGFADAELPREPFVWGLDSI